MRTVFQHQRAVATAWAGVKSKRLFTALSGKGFNVLADFPMAKGILRITREDNSIDEGFERMKASKLGLMDLIPDSLVDTSEVLDLVGLHDGDVDTAEDIEDVRNVGHPISELEVFDNENDGKRLDQSQI